MSSAGGNLRDSGKPLTKRRDMPAKGILIAGIWYGKICEKITAKVEGMARCFI